MIVASIQSRLTFDGPATHYPYQHQEEWIASIGIADKPYGDPKGCLHAYIDVHREAVQPFCTGKRTVVMARSLLF